jgi:hypothetical protein
MEKDNPFCSNCQEKDCMVDGDGKCSMIRVYRNAAKIIAAIKEEREDRYGSLQNK